MKKVILAYSFVVLAFLGIFYSCGNYSDAGQAGIASSVPISNMSGGILMSNETYTFTTSAFSPITINNNAKIGERYYVASSAQVAGGANSEYQHNIACSDGSATVIFYQNANGAEIIGNTHYNTTVGATWVDNLSAIAVVTTNGSIICESQLSTGGTTTVSGNGMYGFQLK